MNKIWIDITNTPHVLFFEPVLKELDKRGISYVITARDFAQTYDLLDKKGIPYIKVGKHGGDSRLRKAINFIKREIKLFNIIRKESVNLSLGHASYDSAVISKFLGLKSITTFDYEYATTIHKILLKYVTKCIVPSVIPKDRLTVYGIDEHNIHFYNGLKEDIYLKDFKADFDSVENYFDRDKINVFVRPPAEMSEYYKGIKEHLAYELCEFLDGKNDYNVIIAPRDNTQLKKYRDAFKDSIVLDHAFNGPQMMYFSDIVISSGGTMIREAAALGSLSISTTELKIGAVDEYLINKGLLKHITSIKEFSKLTKEDYATKATVFDDRVFNEYIEFVLGEL